MSGVPIVIRAVASKGEKTKIAAEARLQVAKSKRWRAARWRRDARIIRVSDPGAWRSSEIDRGSRGSIPDTWVTVLTGDMGNTLAPRGPAVRELCRA